MAFQPGAENLIALQFLPFPFGYLPRAVALEKQGIGHAALATASWNWTTSSLATRHLVEVTRFLTMA